MEGLLSKGLTPSSFNIDQEDGTIFRNLTMICSYGIQHNTIQDSKVMYSTEHCKSSRGAYPECAPLCVATIFFLVKFTHN